MDGKYLYDVDVFMSIEKVKRTKGIARGKNKYTNKNGDMEIEVKDDCSGFAEAVFLSFIKDHKFDGADKITDLWYGSSAFANGTALKKLEKYGFKCYKASGNNNAMYDEKDSLQYLLGHGGLQYGDLVCADGHVEFYRDEIHTFGWGNTHNSYEDNEGYNWVWSDTENCLYDKKLEKADGTVSLSKSDKYVAVYRYEGGK